MDGPVVQAAQKALETKNINLILIWIPPENETEIQDIFQKTLNIRELSPEVRELADRLFFETLVRLTVPVKEPRLLVLSLLVPNHLQPFKLPIKLFILVKFRFF